MHLLSALDPSSANQVGVWILGLGGVLGVVYLCVAIANGFQKLLEPKTVASGQETVKHSELTELRIKLETYATKAEMASIRSELEKLQQYTHEQMHNLRNQLQTLTTTQAVIATKQEEHGKIVAKINDRFEVQGTQLARLITLVEATTHKTILTEASSP